MTLLTGLELFYQAADRQKSFFAITILTIGETLLGLKKTSGFTTIIIASNRITALLLGRIPVAMAFRLYSMK